MRKKSFWLRLNPWNPRDRRLCPAPPRGGLRPPMLLCTRRPVSSGATGRRGGVRAWRKRTSRQPGHLPLRRSPFPSVSSSSSSSVSCGFPRLFRLLLQPGVRFPDLPLGAVFQQPFDRVQVSENHVRPELAFRRRVSGFRRSVRLRSVLPALPARLPPVQVQFGDRLSAVRFSGLPPGVGLLFRSFAVRLVHGSYLVSFCVQFSSFCLVSFSRTVFFVSACSCSFSNLVCLSRFELILRVVPAHRRFILYYSRVYYTLVA